ncbi:MAG: site-specific DNA-methyltransferase [Ignavibacterium sp.]|jgi:site-specific DNA-methyltransferase (adenine-specific)|nr:site-specific DNA-methyltransferase [Ignavibacterium sp.]
MNHINKKRAPLNRTLDITSKEAARFRKSLLKLESKSSVEEITGRIINQDIFSAAEYLPVKFVDLLFIDPPYNLNKNFSTLKFREMKNSEYEKWTDSWLQKIVKILKPDASIYFCCDWKTSIPTYNVLKKYFNVRNRITWEREKGRGAKDNWKNSYEDIWYCTVSDKFTFNTDAVKLKRLVRAPYKSDNGNPKDWKKENGKNFRITHPSNLWNDITIPFWSMPENTDHPTQKPEKLLAKIILASTNENDFVFDPFLGSGTTAVTAKKLNRKFCGVEIDETFAALASKRLEFAEKDKSIQGYHDGVFWERNSLMEQKKK